jgi:hypothetical protein
MELVIQSHVAVECQSQVNSRGLNLHEASTGYSLHWNILQSGAVCECVAGRQIGRVVSDKPVTSTHFNLLSS